jgi:tetratricopeptide (TPR) repeat protein
LPALAQHEIARVLPEVDVGVAPMAGEGQRLVMQRALRSLLQTQGQLRGLIVDDLHFADEASLEMLRALIDSGAEPDAAPNDNAGIDTRNPDATPPLHWVLAYRPADAGSPVQALHDGLLEQARVLALPLRPLDEAALAELVDSLALPGVQGHLLAPGLLRRTGGNPLFVLETLKQAWVERTLAQLADAANLPKPLSVSRLIERRVTQLTSGALALARVASIAGVDFGIALAEAVLGASAMQFADALNELEAAQVLRGTQFAHDLVFDAVRHSVPRPIAQHTHARVAAWLETNGGEPARVAQHFVEAGRGTQALPWLQRAADAARRALRSKEYIAFMEHKSRIEEAAGDRATAFDSLLAAAVESANVDRGGAVTAAHCDGLDRLASTPAQRVEALSQRAHAEHLHGQIEQAMALGQAALRACLPLGDAALIARVRRQLGAAYAIADRGAEALEQLQASIVWTDANADDTTRGEAHGEMAVLCDNLGRLDDALPHHQLCMDLLRSGGELSNLSVACGNLACNRIDAGDIAAADRSIQQGQQVLLAFDDFGGHIGTLQVLRALTLCHLGRYGEALAHAERGVESMRRYQPGFAPRAALRLAHCWWHLGQWARVGGVLVAQVPDANASLSERVAHGRLAWACARESGSDRAATTAAHDGLLAALAELSALPEGARPDLALPLRIDLAGVQRDTDAALRELDAARTAAERIGHRGSVLAARIRAAAIALDHDPQRARSEALAALELAAQGRHNTVLLPAELWLHAARALQAAGDADGARRVVQEGLDWLHHTAREQVPESFRESFLHRNPANRALLALGSRLAA